MEPPPSALVSQAVQLGDQENLKDALQFMAAFLLCTAVVVGLAMLLFSNRLIELDKGIPLNNLEHHKQGIWLLAVGGTPLLIWLLSLLRFERGE